MAAASFTDDTFYLTAHGDPTHVAATYTVAQDTRSRYSLQPVTPPGAAPAVLRPLPLALLAMSIAAACADTASGTGDAVAGVDTSVADGVVPPQGLVVYEISPATGDVERIVDCSEVLRLSGRRTVTEVLNGIAYDPERGTFWVTGKHWPTLFELDLTP